MLEHSEAIGRVCEELGVFRLDVFGSVARSDSNDHSDVDFVASLDRSRGNMFSRYFDLKERLERMLGRPVDIVLEDSIENPYFRRLIERDRLNVYGS